MNHHVNERPLGVDAQNDRSNSPALPTSPHTNNNPTGDLAGQASPKKSVAFYLTFIAVLLNLLVYTLDATSLAVATPTIAAELAGTTLQSFWASISYLLVVAVTQPLYATLSDTLGRKPCLYAAYLLFAAGSIVFALAKEMSGVIVGRVLQGLGGGGLDVLSEIVVTDMTTLQERSLYLGLLAIPTALGSVLGPTIGGLFSGLVTWRWLGWINLPLLGLSFPITVFFLRLRSLEKPRLSGLRTLDWVGIALFSIGAVLVALPLSWAGSLYPWSSFRTLLPLLIGVAALFSFAFYEGKPVAPIMPHRLFKSRTATATLFGVFFHGVLLYSLLQWLPLLYQACMSKTVLQSAVLLIPGSAACVTAAVGGVTAIGLAKTGYKWTIGISWVLITIGTGILVLFDSNSSDSMLYGLPVIWAVGIGVLLRLLYLPLQASLTHVDDTGLAIGVLLTVRLLGGLLGLSICSTVFSSYFMRSIEALGSLPSSLDHLKDPEAAVAFIPQMRTLVLPDDVVLPITQAYLTSIRAAIYTMTGFGGLGLLTTFLISDLSYQSTERGQQHFQG
ncbi:unnamed protein product [Clonostachys rosea]|uniref:Major facilitator superfamily (MFS) profile domain-containing protein n=1 Tax=Bionectria ochroleuca TaxID=29856 RepID=A0ABY6UII3_BIOOC|nr:unnamed protein product [Clonostachys rosea]